MDLSEQSLQRLIDLVYDAVEHPERWRRFYEALQPAIGVRSIHMLALDKRHGALSYSDGANMPVEGELAYINHYRLIDPRLGLLAGTAIGQWIDTPAALGDEIAATHPLYQEFLLPYDRRYNTACKLVDQPEATVIFSVLSGESEGALSAPARAFLDRLLPHLQRACRIGLQNFVYSTQALVGHMLVNKLRQPVILMTPEGEVMHCNRAAEELLRSTSLARLDGSRLHLPAPYQQQLLKACAAMEQERKSGQAAAEVQQPAGAQFRSLRITDGTRRGDDALYAFYSMLSPGSVMGSFGLRPVVMLLFYHPTSAPPVDTGLLYAVFGLTPAESRIATLLAEGLSLKQIADVQGTQHDTVRKQLRSIYQKTSTNRQPELVRLLLHLPHHAVQD